MLRKRKSSQCDFFLVGILLVVNIYLIFHTGETSNALKKTNKQTTMYLIIQRAPYMNLFQCCAATNIRREQHMPTVINCNGVKLFYMCAIVQSLNVWDFFSLLFNCAFLRVTTEVGC